MLECSCKQQTQTFIQMKGNTMINYNTSEFRNNLVNILDSIKPDEYCSKLVERLHTIITSDRTDEKLETDFFNVIVLSKCRYQRLSNSYYIVIDSRNDRIYLWHGQYSSEYLYRNNNFVLNVNDFETESQLICRICFELGKCVS